MAESQSSGRCGSRHPLIDNLAADRRVWKVSGILTNLSSMFIIVVNGLILRRHEAGGGRSAHGQSEKVSVLSGR